MHGEACKGSNSGILFCPPAQKGVNSKKKEFAHRSKFFLFRVDPIFEGLFYFSFLII